MKIFSSFIAFSAVFSLGLVLLVQIPQPATAANSPDFIEFTINVPEDVLSMTHGFNTGLMKIPPTITSLSGSADQSMLAVTARLRNAGGEFVGIASELEVFPDAIGPRPGMSWKTDWTITTKQGSLFIYQEERVPDAHIPAFSQLASGQNWHGSIIANISSGPHPSGRGIIIGGTGVYAGRTGTFIERVDLTGLTTKGEMLGVMYLQIYLDKK